MGAFANQYSFFMPFALLFAILAVVFTLRKSKRGFALLGVGVAGLAVAAIVLTTPRATTMDVSSAASIQNALQVANRPTLVHFHSHY
jgi:hypothetical protein